MVKLRKKPISGGRQSLYLDIYMNGNRSYEFLKMYLTKDRVQNKDVMKLADNIRAKKELELNSNEHGFVPSFKKRITLLNYYESVAIQRADSKNEGLFSTLAHLRRYRKGNIPLASVNVNWLEGFENYLKTFVCENSVLTYFNNLKALFNRAVKEKIIGITPFTYYRKMKKPDVERTCLTIEELRALAKTESDRPNIKRAFIFSCYTGLRLSDVENLQWSNVNGDKLDFRQKKTKGFEYLPLSATAKKLIYPDGERILGMPKDKVFNLPSQEIVTRAIKRWVAKAGINKRVTFHTARHTFATVALTQGVDLYTVSKLLGHTDIKNTQIYAKIIDSKKKEAMDMMPEIRIG